LQQSREALIKLYLSKNPRTFKNLNNIINKALINNINNNLSYDLSDEAINTGLNYNALLDSTILASNKSEKVFFKK